MTDRAYDWNWRQLVPLALTVAVIGGALAVAFS